MKLISILSVGIIFLSIIFSEICINKQNNVGISDITDYDSFYNLIKNNPVQTADFDAEYDGETAQNLKESKDYYIDCLNDDWMFLHSEMQILVVTATDKMNFYQGGYSQEIVINDVIKGDTNQVNNTVTLSNSTGTCGILSDENGILYFSSSFKNVMLEDKTYLVFCEKTETSNYYVQTQYRVLPTIFSILCLDGDQQTVPSEQTYDAYKDCEFLATYESTLIEFNKIKNEIIDKFLY